MKILITGGSGFIGTNLIETLQKRGYHDIINFDKKEPFSDKQKEFWVKGNLMDTKGLKKAFDKYKPETVIHLAARTDTLSSNLEDYNENHFGTKNLLDVIKNSKEISRVIITSTQYVYKSLSEPLPDDEQEFKPHTVYGESKVLTEKFTRESNLSCCWTIIRPCNIWGPWHYRYPKELWRLLALGRYFHPTNNPVIRTYGYVKNITHQIVGIMEADDAVVDKKCFYLGDSPIDSFVWLKSIAVGFGVKRIRVFPLSLFKVLALGGDVLKWMGLKFPIYTERLSNMLEDYPAPTKKTIELFGIHENNLDKNIKETIEWIYETFGKEYPIIK